MGPLEEKVTKEALMGLYTNQFAPVVEWAGRINEQTFNLPTDEVRATAYLAQYFGTLRGTRSGAIPRFAEVLRERYQLPPEIINASKQAGTSRTIRSITSNRLAHVVRMGILAGEMKGYADEIKQSRGTTWVRDNKGWLMRTYREMAPLLEGLNVNFDEDINNLMATAEGISRED